MMTIVQRVSEAKVVVDEQTVGAIGNGIVRLGSRFAIMRAA